ncbi:carotenoid biosynthesis protein [Alkalihalobacterium elongatum]|uniref:carotenoid biosynthesis protein n=1 Tax=Alkalihalobacterium elongatum TaxID=2675466 RepID=UPI001C1F8EC0|nr:carotenoid biosynthesis protein [Alkalihalobacterium elongatum]
MKVQEFTYRMFIFWYVIGIILLSLDVLPPWLEWANAVFLILAGILGGIYFILQYGAPLGWTAILVIFFFTILAESLGVEYGLFFGDYYYEPDFGVHLLNVPITIGFAWLMVMATTHVITKGIVKSLPYRSLVLVVYPILGALAAVIMDLAIDPVAYQVKQYWIWMGDGGYYGVPFSNFVGWFIISFVLHVFLYSLFNLKRVWNKKSIKPWEYRMVLLYAQIIIMFVVIASTAKLWMAAFLPLILMVKLLVIYFLTRGARWDD